MANTTINILASDTLANLQAGVPYGASAYHQIYKATDTGTLHRVLTDGTLSKDILLSEHMLITDYDSTVSGVVDDAELLEGNDSDYHLDRANHTGAQAITTITGLADALNSKSDVTHTHAANGISNAPTGNLTATDVQSALNELQVDVDGRAPIVHTHVKADITDFVESDYATGAEGDLATSATQPGDNISTLNNDAGYITSAPAAPVTSVNGEVGVVVLDKTDIGLGNVDNTTDLLKPISTATQSALDGKSNVGHTHTASEVTDFDTEVSNNSSVVANTAKVTNVNQNLGVSGTTDPSLTIDQGGTDVDFTGTGTVTITNAGGTINVDSPEVPRHYQEISTTFYDPDNPLSGWTQPTVPTNSTAVIEFDNGVGRYFFNGTVWTLVHFEYKEIFKAIGSVDITENSVAGGTLSATYKGEYFRTYFTYMKSNPGLFTYVNYFDWDTGVFGTEVEWGQPRASAQDTHARPAILISADGYIIITQEQLTGTGTNAHNSAIHIRRSSNREDITTWAAVSGSPFSGNLSYPKCGRLPSGRLMIVHRNYPNDVVNFISDDNGATWTNFDGTSIVDGNSSPYVITLTDGSWAYGEAFPLPEGFMMTVNRRLDASNHYIQTYGIFTFDAEIYGNWEWYAGGGKGGVYKDCTTDGALSLAELDADFVISGIAGSNDTNAQYGFVRDAKVSEGYLAIVYTTVISSVLALWFKVYDSNYNVVTETDIYANTHNAPASYNLTNPAIIPIKPLRGVYDLLMKEQDGEMVKYSTKDFGATWTRQPKDLTEVSSTSLSFRANSVYESEYGIQTYMWEDTTPKVYFYAERDSHIEKEYIQRPSISSKAGGEPDGSDVVLNVVSLTQAEYDAGTPLSTTFYIITDA